MRKKLLKISIAFVAILLFSAAALYCGYKLFLTLIEGRPGK